MSIQGRIDAVYRMRSAKREGELKSAFTQCMKDHLPNYYMLLLASRGAPDRAIVGNGQTTWWEFKHGTPSFESPGLQELTCMRLAEAGYCRYVLWMEDAKGRGKRTLIVRPKVVYERSGWSFTPEAWCLDFDMYWLVRYVASIHKG